MTVEERNKWFKQHTIYISFYEKRTKIDFYAQEDAISYQMERLFDPEQIKNKKSRVRSTILRKYELELDDSLINPFGGATHSQKYIQKIGSETTSFDLFKPYQYNFVVDNNTQVVKRIRYNVWMALGDIGGFYDGLRLVLLLFMGPLSAFFFQKDLLKDNLKVQSLTSTQKIQRTKLAE